MKKVIFCTVLLLPIIAVAKTTKGVNYINNTASNPIMSVCANTSTPLPIFISTLRDFGLTSKFSNRVNVSVTAEYWTEEERGIPIKIANFFAMDTIRKPDGRTPLLGNYSTKKEVSPIPMSAREYSGMSISDAGLGKPTKTDRKRTFESYNSQILYIKNRGVYNANYFPRQQAAPTTYGGGEYFRQPDDIIWLPGRAIKKLTIHIYDSNPPASPPELKGRPAPTVIFEWKAKTGYNPKSSVPPILELTSVTYSGQGNSSWGEESASDNEIDKMLYGNASVLSSITLGEKYTLAMDWNRSPIIRDLATNPFYSRAYQLERDAFKAGDLDFAQLVNAISQNKKLSAYDINLKKTDFIYTNIDAINRDLGWGHGGKYKITYFRGSINAYNNVYIDQEKYEKDGSIMKICD
ncbi:hypothetical protein MIB43_009550 [Providencia rettgeri]|uniref:hypothetical protein n=1 Tax=Providencia rettgeri TaxID=587 RepID=UPI001F03EB94|nr:hypothetical protein [Providencia rettgeri]MCG9950168.1 hypothetical protein [Providencia rettgeri]